MNELFAASLMFNAGFCYTGGCISLLCFSILNSCVVLKLECLEIPEINVSRIK